MFTQSDRALHKIFVAAGVIPSEALERAVKAAETGKRTFWKTLSESSGIDESGLYEILSQQTGVPLIPLKKISVDAKAREKVPVKIAWYYKFFPYKMEDGKICVAFPQIPDVSILDEIRFGIGVDVLVALAPESDIEEMLNKHYGLGADMVNKIISQTPESTPYSSQASTHQVEDIEKGEDGASVAQLVNQIILDAYKKRASDIHFEPYRGKVRLRYRIDGVLHEAPVPEEMRKFFSSILSRIKIMSNLNVVEKRLPQDGKMRVKTADQNLDLRVSSIPTAHGESMVIRILTGKNVWSLDALGFEPNHLTQIKELLQRPNGIIFATGPTGSGKSTTLYACLTSLNSEERKIITIEDPVEYELEGISQIQVASDIGFGFSQGLRSVLRHDPDVLMVGEVRDLETADISIRAALTGHLILSTLHTNDAASGITRLTDIGVEKYLIASSVIGFIAQRLIRVTCPKCKAPNLNLDSKIRDHMVTCLGLQSQSDVKTFYGKGCDQCNGTGYSGRQAIHEVLLITDEIRKMIMEGAPAGNIKLIAMKRGMQSLRQDGFQKVLQGITTPEEIMRVAPSDGDHVDNHLIHDQKTEEDFLPMSISSDANRDAEVLASVSESTANVSTEEVDRRRKFKRVEIHLPMTYRIIEPVTQHPQLIGIKDYLSRKDWAGDAQDISAGGLLFSSENMGLEHDKVPEVGGLLMSDAVGVGTVLELRITLPDTEKPVNCIGRVLRADRLVKKVDGVNQFALKIAVLFLVINSHDRLRIENFCKNSANKK